LTYNTADYRKDILKPYHKNLSIGNLITPNAKENNTVAIYAIAIPPLYDDDMDNIHYTDGFSTCILESKAMPIITELTPDFDMLFGLQLPIEDETDEDGYYKQVYEEYIIGDYFSERYTTSPKLKYFRATIKQCIELNLLIPCITTNPAMITKGLNPRTDLQNFYYMSPVRRFDWHQPDDPNGIGTAPVSTPILVWNTSAAVSENNSYNDSGSGSSRVWGGNIDIHGP